MVINWPGMPIDVHWLFLEFVLCVYWYHETLLSYALKWHLGMRMYHELDGRSPTGWPFYIAKQNNNNKK